MNEQTPPTPPATAEPELPRMTRQQFREALRAAEKANPPGPLRFAKELTNDELLRLRAEIHHHLAMRGIFKCRPW